MIVSREYRSASHFILLGLCKEIYLLSQVDTINYVYALVDNKIFLLLKRIGFVFMPIGNRLKYMGEVLPTILSKEDLEKNLPKNNLWLYEYFKSPKEDQSKWF